MGQVRARAVKTPENNRNSTIPRGFLLEVFGGPGLTSSNLEKMPGRPVK